MESNLSRLRGVSSFALELDEYQEKLRPFVELAQSITGSVTCEINIIDAYNQWTISRTEEEFKVLAKEESICQHTVAKNEPHEVHDLESDSRYHNRAYVEGSPWYRYYCGVQLSTSDDLNIGSLCVLDTTPKHLDDQQKKQLQHIADAIVDKLEKERDLKEMVSKLDELKDTFHKFNHDMRNPINGIVGFTKMLTDEDVTGNRERKLAMIRDCALTISDEMEAMLQAVDDDSRHRLRKKLPLVKLPEKIDRLYRPQAESKEISLTLNYGVEEEIVPHYYVTKMTQIVGNLVANALKFTSEGGGVEVAFKKNDAQHLQITVKDDGIGMDPDQVEAFNQQEEVFGTEGTAGEVSYGIGLQHVRGLVRAEGGSIEVESAKGEGTCFTVSLPL